MTRTMKGVKNQRILENIIFYCFLTLILIFFLFPIILAMLTSVKTLKLIFTLPPPLLFQPTFENWEFILIKSDFLRYLGNSIIIGVTTVVPSVIIGSAAAYALARFDFSHKEDLSFWILSQRIFPPVAILVPMFLLFYMLKLINTYIAMIIIYLTFSLPFAVLMMRGFLEDIPKDLDEAAMVDGCSRFSAFWRVILPVAMPGIMATALFCFLMCINEFLFALMITGLSTRTLSVALTLFLPQGTRGTQYGQASAGTLLTMVPILILSIFLQKYLVRGMTLGAVKK